MENLWFHPPVPVKMNRPSIRLNVNSVQSASEQLLQWTKCGPEWHKAARICVACLAGEMEPEEARKAFLAAAKEEEVYLPRE
jgi:hypothetical protein